MAPSLFKYQQEGAKFLSERTHALLADEMGLGKTCQAITACNIIEAKRILVLAPASLLYNWVNEFDKFGNGQVCGVFTTKTGGLNPHLNVTVASYNTAVICKDVLSSHEWDVVILDEAHYLKSHAAARTKAVYGKLCKFGGIARSAKRVWALSGTPVLFTAADIWPFLRGTGIYIKGRTEFISQFCVVKNNGFANVITGNKNQSKFKELMSDHILRRFKSDVLKDMPEILHTEVILNSSDQDLIKVMSYEGSVTNAIKPSGDVLAIADHPNHMQFRAAVGMVKVDPTVDMITELVASGKKAVVFATFLQTIEALDSKLNTLGTVVLTGATPPKAREDIVRDFQHDDDVNVFIGQIDAAGVGITLTAASDVFIVEPSWVPAINAQAAMRCHRIGQVNNVTVRYIGLAGSIDARITKVLKDKTKEVKSVMEKV